MELKEYAKIIKKRLWLIIVCVVISTVTTVIYTQQNYIPVYEASTKLIINKMITQDRSGNEQMDLGAISVNIGLVNTYKEIIKTPAIMNKVVQSYPELNLSVEQLISTVRVSALNGTQVMAIDTMDVSYKRAANIVNAVAEVVRTEIPRIMKVNNVEILNVAELNDQPPPVNEKTNRMIIMSFAVSLIFAIGITFLLEFIDDTLQTKQDIQTVTGLPILSMIPDMKGKEMKKLMKKRIRKQAGETKYATTSIRS
jgi:capsular polysaccharide biosynthesis protein